MARICLLFSLAFALTLGSLFLVVFGHASPALPKEPSLPKTVSELQTMPFTEITEYLNRKETFAPKTPEFKAMFTTCKEYVAYLKSLYKYENPIVDVLGIAKTRFALMKKAIIAAQISVNGKVNKENSLKVRKICADLAKGFIQLKDTIIEISVKQKYEADAKINAQESETLEKAMTHFRVAIDNFLDVAKNIQKSHGRSLSLADMLNKNNVGFGGKAMFDAAGKTKVAGKDGFRSLNREHIKHLVSTKA